MASIFSVAEAKAFRHQGQTPLATGFTDPEIQEAADRITEDFATICGVAFVPTTVTDEVLDGAGDGGLLLPHPRVTAVTAAARRWPGQTEWTALTAEELAALVIEPGGIVQWVSFGWGRWPRGAGRVKVTYTHGYATPPAAIKRAALILAVDQLAGSNISDRATQQTDQHGTFNLAVPGWRDGQWYGLPVVDSVLQRYSEHVPGIG